MSIENFKNICKYGQKNLKKYVIKELQSMYEDVHFEKGFVYAQGSFPVLLVAHLDTVHDKTPSKIITNKGKISSPDGIGGDDRCGVYMILEIINKYNCSVLFCEDEEIGCVGAEKFVESKFSEDLIGQFNYIIELDRKGSNDAVFYDCANEDFEVFITKDFYKTAWGSFTDISTIAPYLECAAVNLSCGYYKAHTKEEYVVWDEMKTSVKEVINILARTTDTDKYKYVEAPRVLTYNNYYDKYWGGSYDCYDEDYYFVEYFDKYGKQEFYETYAVSKEEAIGKFLINNPTMCYAEVVDAWSESELYDSFSSISTKKGK